MVLNEKVSIIIPIYNGEHCLSRSVDSALSQTYGNIEIILVDDGSNDKSAEAIDYYVKQNPEKVKYFLKENEGPGKAIEYGVGRASGAYIAFLDQDDLWFEGKIERQMQEFETDPELALVSTDFCRGEEPSEQRESVLQWMKHADKEPFERLLLENPVLAPSIVVKKKVLYDIGFSDKNVSYGPWDRPLFVKIAAKYKTKILNEVLMWKFYHNSTLSLKRNYCELQFLYWEHLLTYFSGLENRYKSMIRRNCAKALYETALYYFWNDDMISFKSNMQKATQYDARFVFSKRHFYFAFIPGYALTFSRKIKRLLPSI